MHAEPANNPTTPRPLVVDLDGTLVATDTLHELLLELVGHRPGGIPRALGALSQGKARFKSVLAEMVELDPAALPYRDEVLGLIREAKDAGRPVVLATASHANTADAVAEHLGLFDAVIASSGKDNRKGADKLEAIRDLLTERGWGGHFDYVGDHAADLPIWSEAHTAYLVEAGTSIKQRVAPQNDTVELVPPPQNTAGEFIRACRPHQWSKNLLLAVPFIAAQEAGELAHWFEFLIAFISFGLCASAVYLVNDLLDLRADRLHPTKRNRPFASGALKTAVGVFAAPLLVLIAVVTSAILLPSGFVWALLVYSATAWLYSIAIKHTLILDVVWLAGLYSLRIIAGGLATSTPASEWLLALILFLFTSIALAKRYAELRLLESEGRTEATGRRYTTDDQPMLSVMGLSSGMLAVLVFALYINHDKVTRLYEHPQVLWIICPLLLYWIGRLWMHAHRRTMRDDPLLFALTDRVSYIVLLLIVLAATYAA